MKPKKLTTNRKQEEQKKNQQHYKVDAELVQMRFYNPAMTGTVAPGGVRVSPPLGQYVPTPPQYQYGAPGYFTTPSGSRVYTAPVRQPVYTPRVSIGRTPVAPVTPVTPVTPPSPAGRPGPAGLFETLMTMPGLLGPYSWLNPYR